MDKLISVFNRNKKVFVFLIGLMIIGIIFGSMLPIFLSEADKKLVTDYLSDFILKINDKQDYLFLIRNGMFNNWGFTFLIWLLGISVIGIPIVLFLFFSKCFVIGFSISSIILNYGVRGILFGFIYTFPHQIINIIIYGIITNYSLIFSIKLLGLIFNKIDFNIKNVIRRYFKIFLFCLLVLFITTLYETFLQPLILRYIFKMLRL